MRIAVFSHYFSSHNAGIEIIAHSLNRRFVSAGQHVTWLASDATPVPSDLPDRYRCVPLPAWNAIEGKTGLPLVVPSPSALRRIDEAVQQADVVHLHDVLYLSNIAAFVSAKRHEVPVLITQHIGLVEYSNPLPRGLMSAGNRTIGKVLLERAGKVVFYSSLVKSYFSDFCDFVRPAELIENGVDGSLFSPPSTDDRFKSRQSLRLATDATVVLFVGRFNEKKGVALMESVCRALPRITFVFAGWGPLDPSAWALANVVVMRGRSQEEMPNLYRSADLLVLPSKGEGFPLVVQEAMACGLPCLVSPEIADALGEGSDLLYRTPRRSEEIERQLSLALADKEGLRSRGRRGAELAAKRWDWEKSAGRYLNAFLSLVG